MPDEATGGAPAQTTNEASQNVDQATPPAAEGAPAQGQPQPQGDGAQPPAQPQTAADVVPPLMGGDEPQSESAGEAPEQYEAFKGADGQEYAPEQDYRKYKQAARRYPAKHLSFPPCRAAWRRALP